MTQTATNPPFYMPSQARSLAKAPVLEIFRSRQGEGLRVGDSHIFVRFGGCNLVCDYCDTPDSIPMTSGQPATSEQVLDRIQELRVGDTPNVVALTGGEPLVQAAFLENFLPQLRERGYRTYLETNGSLPRALGRIMEYCDWVAMDFKLETATQRNLWEAHRWFLEMGGSKIFVKMVLTGQTQQAEFQHGVELLASMKCETPLVLQPATPWNSVPSIPLERLTSWWAWAARQLRDVRIIPQVHRLWGIV